LAEFDAEMIMKSSDMVLDTQMRRNDLRSSEFRSGAGVDSGDVLKFTRGYVDLNPIAGRGQEKSTK